MKSSVYIHWFFRLLLSTHVLILEEKAIKVNFIQQIEVKNKQVFSPREVTLKMKNPHLMKCNTLLQSGSEM